MYQHCSTEKASQSKWGYAGVICFSKIEPDQVHVGIRDESLDIEGRSITLEIGTEITGGVYFPSAGSPDELLTLQKKLDYTKAYTTFIDRLSGEKSICVGGDLNIAFRNSDKFDGACEKHNESFPSCTFEERKAFHDLIHAVKLGDQMERFHQPPPFTWFQTNHDRWKNEGMRIDHILACEERAKRVKYVTTTASTYGSDHRAVLMIQSDNRLDDVMKRHAHPEWLGPVSLHPCTDEDLGVAVEIQQKVNLLVDELRHCFSLKDTSDGPEHPILVEASLNSLNCSVTSLQEWLKIHRDKQEAKTTPCETDPTSDEEREELIHLSKKGGPINMPLLGTEVLGGSQSLFTHSLVDTGAQNNHVSASFLRKLWNVKQIKEKLIEEVRVFKCANGARCHSMGKVNLPLKFDSNTHWATFSVIEGLSIDMILGMPFLNNHQAQLSFGENPSISITSRYGKKTEINSVTYADLPLSCSIRNCVSLHSEKAHIIQAKSHYRLWVKTSTQEIIEKENVFGMIKNAGGDSKVITAAGVGYLNKGRMIVQVFNPSSASVKLKAKSVIADFTPEKEQDFSCYVLNENSDENTEGSTIHDLCVPGTNRLYNNLCKGEDVDSDCLMSVGTPQPISERDYNDTDQVPSSELDFKTEEEVKLMSDKEVLEYFDLAPLKFIEIEHDDCLLKSNHSLLMRLRRLLVSRLRVFSLDDNDPGCAKHPGVKIRLKEGQDHPFCEPLRPTNPKKREQVEKHVQNMLKYNIIEPSESPWGANILLVPKKNPGETRMCIDFRVLNSRTVGMSYPLVRIDDALDGLAGKAVFSTVDANQSFYQLPVAKEDREKLAFRCHLGCFHFKKMPMGMKNSGPIYQKFMMDVLGKMAWECAIVYVDDCIIFSKTIEEHFSHLEKVLSAFEDSGVHLKAKKAMFFRSSMVFLGHKISAKGIEPDQKKIEAILKANPTTKKQIHSWVAGCGYYRKLIPDFAKKVKPLYDLIKSKSRIPSSGLTAIQQNAIEQIRAWLSSSPILAYPQWDKPFEVCTDASTEALGAVLQQRDKNGNPVAVMYISRALRESEKGYHIYELECLALVWAIGVFSHYLTEKFTVWTDNEALTWLQTKKNGANKRILRWVLDLQQYDYEIKHRRSKLNANADSLSRVNGNDANQNYGETVDLTCSIDCFPADYAFMLGEDDVHSFIEDDCEINDSHLAAIVDESSKLPSREELIRAQKKDPYLKLILDKLCQPPFKFENFFMDDGLLLRKTSNPHKFVKGATRAYKSCEQIMVPNDDTIKKVIFFMHHGHITVAHRGFKQAIHDLQSQYYWRGMRTEFKAYIRACLKCQKRKTPRPMNVGSTQTTVAKYVMHKFAFDIVTGLPPTAMRGYTCILTGIDCFSRYCFAVPLASRKIKSVVHALMFIFNQFGFPKVLVSDCEKSFVGPIVRELMKKFGTRKANTTGWQPQANATIERWHRWFKAELTIFANKNKNDWDEHMDTILYAYRTCIHSATGYTPFELMFGRSHRTMTDFLYRTTDRDIEREHSHRLKQTEMIRDTYARVLSNQMRLARANKLYRDKNRKDVFFKKGDYVLIWDPCIDKEGSSSLQYAWAGPGQIVRKSSQNALLFIVDPTPDLENDPSRYRKLHVNRLHLYLPGPYGEHPPRRDLRAYDRKAALDKLFKTKSLPRNGSFVIIVYQQRECDRLPFALLKVLDINKTDGTFTGWWMGNAHSNIFAAQKPGYWQPSTNKHYYRDAPLHKSHPRYTSVVTCTTLTPDDILVSNVPLGIEDNIPFDILQMISDYGEETGNFKWTLKSEHKKLLEGMTDLL